MPKLVSGLVAAAMCSSLALGATSKAAAMDAAPPSGPLAALAQQVATPSPSAPPVRAPEEPKQAPNSGRRAAAWIAGGIGAVALAGGVIAGVMALDSRDKAREADRANDPAAHDKYQDQARERFLVMDALVLAGAACVGTSIYLFASSKPAPAAVAVTPLPGGALAVVGVRF